MPTRQRELPRTRLGVTEECHTLILAPLMSIGVVGQLPYERTVPRWIDQASEYSADQILLFGGEEVAGDDWPRHLPVVGDESPQLATFRVMVVPFEANLATLGLT